jgi:hypothetical protein
MPPIKKNKKISIQTKGIKNRKSRNKKNKKYYKKTKTHKKQKILPIVYGKLHMTGCIHCKMLVPEWEMVKDRMKIHMNVICHDIEQTEESIKLPLFNNNYKPYEPLEPQGGYPTIYKLHRRGGQIIYYKGPRDNQSILQWLK